MILYGMTVLCKKMNMAISADCFVTTKKRVNPRALLFQSTDNRNLKLTADIILKQDEAFLKNIFEKQFFLTEPLSASFIEQLIRERRDFFYMPYLINTECESGCLVFRMPDSGRYQNLRIFRSQEEADTQNKLLLQLFDTNI